MSLTGRPNRASSHRRKRVVGSRSLPTATVVVASSGGHHGRSVEVCSSPAGGAVSRQSEESLLRMPMSWEQYLELPDRPRAEWVHGVAVIVNAPPRFGHGRATLE